MPFTPWFDHAFAFGIALVLPVYAFATWRSVEADLTENSPGTRVREYRFTIRLQLSLTAILIVAWHLLGRSPSALGLAPPSGWRGALSGAVAAVAVGFCARQYRSVVTSPRLAAQARAQIEAVPGAKAVIPRTAEETRVFLLAALTAGVCEELLYRGFLVGYLAGFVPGWLAVLVAAAIFGVGHRYQGARGALQVGAGAVVLGGLFLATGSLVGPMVLHLALDIGNGLTARAALQATDEATAQAPSDAGRNSD